MKVLAALEVSILHAPRGALSKRSKTLKWQLSPCSFEIERDRATWCPPRSEKDAYAVEILGFLVSCIASLFPHWQRTTEVVQYTGEKSLVYVVLTFLELGSLTLFVCQIKAPEWTVTEVMPYLLQHPPPLPLQLLPNFYRTIVPDRL